MRLTGCLEHATGLDPLVQAGQRAARLVRPGRIRDVLYGTWLRHPLHEQQMRVSVVHAMGNALAIGLYGASLALRGSRRGRWLRLCGLASLSGAGPFGGHLAFRLAGGALQVMLPGAG
jgi:hypothetical protein